MDKTLHGIDGIDGWLAPVERGGVIGCQRPLNTDGARMIDMQRAPDQADDGTPRKANFEGRM